MIWDLNFNYVLQGLWQDGVREWVIAGTSAAVAAIVILLVSGLLKPSWERRKMRRERELILNIEASDDIFNVFFERYHTDKWTKEEYLMMCRRFGRLLPLTDLLKRGEQTLKAELQQNKKEREEKKPKKSLLASLNSAL